jgi:hypothetical protein
MLKIILSLLTLSCIIYAAYVLIKTYKPFKLIFTVLAFVSIATLLLVSITLLF